MMSPNIILAPFALMLCAPVAYGALRAIGWKYPGALRLLWIPRGIWRWGGRALTLGMGFLLLAALPIPAFIVWLLVYSHERKAAIDWARDAIDTPRIPDIPRKPAKRP
jgi:hypothetical protein